MSLQRHSHSHRPSYTHTHLLPSFLRKVPRMSTFCLRSTPQLPQEILDFEDSLLLRLSSLKPHDRSPILCLDWLVRGLDLVLAKHKEAVELIPPFQGSSLPCDEKWVNDYFDQTTRILDACNLVSAQISHLEQGNLLLRYAVNKLRGSIIFSNEGKVSRARESLRQWLDTVHLCKQESTENARTGKSSSILQEMCDGLVVPKERDSRKGFLFALCGANATAVFVFAVLMIALTRDEELLSLSLPLASEIPWTQPILDLMELARGEARLCISDGSVLWLRDLYDLNLAVSGLLIKLDATAIEKQFTSTEDHADKLTEGVDALNGLVNDFATRLESLGRKQNEVFQAVVASRSALLDQLGQFGADHKA